jgi:hypothetical protein
MSFRFPEGHRGEDAAFAANISDCSRTNDLVPYICVYELVDRGYNVLVAFDIV